MQKTSRVGSAAIFSITSLLILFRVGAQEYTFTTLAGPDESPGAIDGPTNVARFGFPTSVAVDSSGNVYVADTLYNYGDGSQGNYTIRKITPGGVVTTLAGLAGTPGSADGAGSKARFNTSYGIAVDNASNVYLADTWNYTIRKISPGGVVTTLAGLAGSSGTNDGIGSAARFSYPTGVAVDSTGNIYVTDSSTIRKLTPGGVVTTFAGVAGSFGTNDGSGAMAQFGGLTGIAVDLAGNLYVTDKFGSLVRIRKVSPSGDVTTPAGGFAGYADGSGSEARFDSPQGIAVDGTGNVFVADTANFTIRQIGPDGMTSTLAGSAITRGSADGIGGDAAFNFPQGIAASTNGTLYVADTLNCTIRGVLSDGTVTTLAGVPRSGARGADADGPGLTARFLGPWNIAMDNSGNSYVAEINAIRQVTPDGNVLTIASDYYGNPYGVAVDYSGNIYVADSYDSTILRVDSSGGTITLAGLSGSGGSANGTGSTARFRDPRGVGEDAAGIVYVADTDNATIRKVTPDGVVTTLAGLARAYGTNDGTGSSARFGSPYGIVVDSATNVYVSDLGNYSIRKITSSGVVTTLAGGQYGGADGAGNAAQFWGPKGLTVDAGGNIYVTDTAFVGVGTVSAIRKVTPDGIVTTLAGGRREGEIPGGFVNGSGAEAQFDNPLGVTVGSLGNLFVADSGNGSIRVGTTNTCPDKPTIDLGFAPISVARQLDTTPQTAIAWRWSLIRQPSASSATLSASNVRNPTFTPDVADLYVFRLFATNASGAFCIRTISLTATVPPPKLTISPDGYGGYFITAQGQPNFTCRLQRASNVSGPWISSPAQTADDSGLIQFHDLFASPSRAFYRTVQ